MRQIVFISILIVISISCKKDDQEPKAKACFHNIPSYHICVDDTVTFYNCAENATAILWDFGDSTFSIEELPTHIYTKAGNYFVKQIAINDNSIDTLIKEFEVVVSTATILCSKVWTLSSIYENMSVSSIPNSSILWEDWVFYENGTLIIEGYNNYSGYYSRNYKWSLKDYETKLCFTDDCWIIVNASDETVLIDFSPEGDMSQKYMIIPRE